MQFFDLNRQYPLTDLFVPTYTLENLAQQEWFLAKISIDYDCLEPKDSTEGRVLLQSNHNVQIELEWLIHDTGYELQVLFKGIETEALQQTLVFIKGAELVDSSQHRLSIEALSLWIDGTLLPMLPHLRRDIKQRLNLWDYVEYDV